MVKLENITSESFKKFGNIIEFPYGNKENFYIVDTEQENPWRLAVFRYDNKTIKTIECHPNSKESFEPLSGVTALLVAEQNAPKEYRVFLLDKPVCLKKNIWHQIISLSEQAQGKITENLNVESVFYDLPKEIEICIM